MSNPLSLSIAIPTYRRERVLIDSIDALLRLDPPAAEILIIDQTAEHEPEVERRLREWDGAGRIRWLRLPTPSIPKAMNVGLLEASHPLVLFLDDDIIPFPDLVAAHVAAHGKEPLLVAGRVLQPWHGDIESATWESEQFASTDGKSIDEFMGGNFSLRRDDAIRTGGFDENFVRVAYNFEREFSERWRAGGRRIRFHPEAAIRHLKASGGGTRTFGDHLTTLLPAHSVGAYYYLLRCPLVPGRLRHFVARPFRSVATRHHLRRPWWIPATLMAELAGMGWAFWLHLRGPRYCTRHAADRG
jgi:GT2 family glycosyltransferase